MRAFTAVVAGLFLLAACDSKPKVQTLRLATTTSVVDSGLLDILKPALEKRGLKVDVAAVGSGQALAKLVAKEAEVAITHSPDEEKEALAAGKIDERLPFMRNDFVIVGPPDAASVVAGSASAAEAMKRIAASGRHFVSRGDKSGTNNRELKLWKQAGVTDTAFVVAANAGMGKTLARAAEEKAFTLADRGTWLAQKNGLAIVFQDDPALANIYSVLLPKDASPGAQALVELVRSAEGRALIGGYGVEKFGEAAFTPVEGEK